MKSPTPPPIIPANGNPPWKPIRNIVVSAFTHSFARYPPIPLPAVLAVALPQRVVSPMRDSPGIPRASDMCEATIRVFPLVVSCHTLPILVAI